MVSILRVLFVSRKDLFRGICTVQLFEKEIKKNELEENITCTSAGIDVLSHEPPPKVVQKIAKEYGFDLSAKRSQMISKQMASDTDIVIAMDQNIYNYLNKKYSKIENRIFLFKEFDLDESLENPDIEELEIFTEPKIISKLLIIIENEIKRISPKLFQIAQKKKRLADERNQQYQ
jgi:protein-tyrosine-phosphatase